MKVTRISGTRPLITIGGLLSGATGGIGPSGQIPTSNGSNGVAWGSNISDIFVNGTDHVMGPFVNFANGSNTTVTVDKVGSVPSNTIRVHATGGGSVSAGSNSTHVQEISTAGASSTLWSPYDHAHAGIAQVTASSSNTLQRGTLNLRAGAGVTFSLSDTDGDGELDTLTFLASGSSGGSGGSSNFPIGFNLGDKIPASPGTYDQEFEGAADALPSGWAWVSSAPTYTINSDFPSMFVIKRAASDANEYKIRYSGFSAASTFGIWVKLGNDFINGASSQWEFIAYDSTSQEGYGAGIHNGYVPLGRWSNGGTLANRGSGDTSGQPTWFYLGVTRSSNNWEAWYSNDGINWRMMQSAESKTFTVDRLELRWSSDGPSSPTAARCDWIRYRTDTLKPRP